MTFYYRTTSYGAVPPPKEEIDFWTKASEKKNWRIVRLPNGYYQTEITLGNDEWRDVTRRKTIEGAEGAINSSVEHFAKKIEFANGPTVVKTFE